ncbi:hypothetical protein M0638_21025 [Roseomonas sp. NAR14]|uniref:Magnesium transporter MgtE intracellular domain-containing protein n=1 Tax=Roseomonas acroporae TaxID=2937791 RepID=A0A9X1YD73_9PROT|nr:hypothetical protein [Roseomonas acroporae]MCK8786860.1 hypothetical protein [Roseomonas acroporae]
MSGRAIRWRLRRPRLLPIAMAAMAVVLALKAEGLTRRGLGVAEAAVADAAGRSAAEAGAAARPVANPPGGANMPPPVARLPAIGSAVPSGNLIQPDAPTPLADPAVAAERAVLEGLRARRAELEARDRRMSEREVVLQAAERRLAARVDEMATLQRRLEALERTRTEREEAGWRSMVKLYEGMRPRDAAAVFDELDMPLLVEVVDRMREAKAAPVLGAMRPERVRQLTAELARHRARALPSP